MISGIEKKKVKEGKTGRLTKWQPTNYMERRHSEVNISSDKKFPLFYGTPSITTMFTSPHHLSLSWDKSNLVYALNPIFWRSILIYALI